MYIILSLYWINISDHFIQQILQKLKIENNSKHTKITTIELGILESESEFTLYQRS